MEKIDFNHDSFSGFEHGEDILLDTSVLLALIADYDPWHETVLKLFNNHIFPDESVVLLYTNPLIINEVLHLSHKSLARFMERFSVKYNESEKLEKINFIEKMLTIFIEEKILNVLDGDANSILQQVKLSQSLGAADASNVSIANLYGTSFLTVDRKLADNIETHSDELSNIKNVYYTTSRHKSYHT